MTETTTPDAPEIEAPVIETAQPTEQEQPEAVTTTEEPNSTDPSSDAPAPADNAEEEDLADYWSKKGIDITTPEGQRKAAQSYREAERAMTRKSQEASKLSQQLTEQPVEELSTDPLVQELANEVVTMKRAQMASSFRERVNLTADAEQKMATYLTENPQKIQLVNAGLLSLDEVYSLSGAGNQDPEVLKKQGGQQALTELAQKQRATAVKGAATTQATKSSGDSLSDLEERLASVTF